MSSEAQIGVKMKYLCPKCKQTYTIPIGDKMISKENECVCGVKAKSFEVTDNVLYFEFPESMMIFRD